jgi:uncharacterized membrane protein
MQTCRCRSGSSNAIAKILTAWLVALSVHVGTAQTANATFVSFDIGSTGKAISSIGRTVAGLTAIDSSHVAPFRSGPAGSVLLQDPAWSGFITLGMGVSGAGTKVAGSGIFRSGNSSVARAYVWAGSSASPLAGPDITKSTSGYGISNDGHVVTGQYDYAPALWTDGQYRSLGVISMGSCTGVSESGRVVTGYYSENGVRAFVWSPYSGRTDLPSLTGGLINYSMGLGVSASGRIVVGLSTGPSGTAAVRWTSDGIEELGDLPGGATSSRAFACNGDGSVIVGVGTSANGEEAVVWTPEDHQVRALVNILSEYGAGSAIAGWKLKDAKSVSRDGLTIVGSAIDPQGKGRAYKVKLPPRFLNTIWGVRVKFDYRQGEDVEDFLIAFEGGWLIPRAAMSIEPVSSGGELVVKIADGTPVTFGATSVPTEDLRIAPSLLAEGALALDGTGAGQQVGFNKFFFRSSGTIVKTGSLQKIPITSGQARWNYTPVGSAALLNKSCEAVYALPRTKGENDALGSTTAEMLTTAAAQVHDEGATQNKSSVPPQILYAVAWQESFNSTLGRGWNQFGFTGATGGDPADDLRTGITADGGIGMMQLTGATAILERAPGNQGGCRANGIDVLTHLYRLGSSPNYNIQAGAYVLGKMKKYQVGLDTTVNSGAALEHWTKAIKAYNGTNNAAYVTKVLAFMKTPPYPDHEIEGVVVQNLSATTGYPFSPSKVFDVDFDGVSDFKLATPVVGTNLAKITVVPAPGVLILSVTAKRTSNSSPVSLSLQAGNLYQGALPGAGSTGTFTVRVDVRGQVYEQAVKNTP